MRSTLAVVRSFPAHPSVLYHVRQFVRERASEAAFAPQDIEELVLAVSEACANSVLHSASAKVRVAWKANGSCVEVTVQDQGVFERRVRMPELEPGNGHGIPLMMALVDELTIREGTPRRPGTVVRLIKCKDA